MTAVAVNVSRLRAAIRKYCREFVEAGKVAEDEARREYTAMHRAHYAVGSPVVMLGNMCAEMVADEVNRLRGRDIAPDVVLRGTGSEGRPVPKGLKCVRSGTKKAQMRVLSSGFFGVVYQIDRDTCVKVIHLNRFMTDRASLVDIKRKVRTEFATSKLAGEHGIGPVVHKTYTCCEDVDGESNCYAVIVMELLKGMPLTDWAALGPTGDAMQRVQSMIRRKLDVLHNKLNVVHRDLHAKNIMVLFDARNVNVVDDVKIIDFGLSAKLADREDFINSDNMSWMSMFAVPDVHLASVYVATRLLQNNEVVLS